MASKTVSWRASSGQLIEFRVAATESTGMREFKVSARVDGEEHRGYMIRMDHPTVAARFGSIGIVQDNLDLIDEAIAAVEETFADHNASCERHAAELNAVCDEGRRIEQAMAYGE